LITIAARFLNFFHIYFSKIFPTRIVAENATRLDA
jgi:hypothetical protein